MFRSLLISAVVAAMAVPAALADTKTEEYVRANANDVLDALNSPELDAEGRRAAFQTYMDQFANIDTVSKFVIGKYAKRFSPEDLERYQAAFRVYALAVYEFYFNEFKGREVAVTGSQDRTARDSIVDTRITSENGREMDVRWRVLNRGDRYQVVDVALEDEGNLIWLAIEQRAQFLAILDQSNGSADTLINKIEDMTADIVAQREE
ncbi:MAG: ABC transporter substrate-binding protein [Henriciella sp.]|nr:ABC transporter substrate-binding protein [Henriciella sp.]